MSEEIEVVGQSIAKPKETSSTWKSISDWFTSKTTSKQVDTKKPIEIEEETPESWYSFSNIKNKLKNLSPFTQPPEEPQSFFEQLESSINGYITLSYTQRLYGFLFTFGLGLLCFFIAVMLLSGILLTARIFAVFYTLGNIFIFSR